MKYKVLFSREAQKDAINIQKSKLKLKLKLKLKCQSLIELIADDPFAPVPPYEKLVGDLDGFYSRRINIQHRLVYEVDTIHQIVKVLRMWSHYD